MRDTPAYGPVRYVRTSTRSQRDDSQLDALPAGGCERNWTDTAPLAERLRADYGIPVRLLAAEAPHARGQVIEEAPKLQVLRAAWRPQVLLWGLRILRAGATRAERLTEVKPFDAGSGPLDVLGHLVPVPTLGHTSGHCAFHLPGRGPWPRTADYPVGRKHLPAEIAKRTAYRTR